jgi:hypothetical protein
MTKTESPRFKYIARKMMTGFGKNKPTIEQFEEFKRRYHDAIVWVDRVLPTKIAGKIISWGVLGAIGKGVLWYGPDKMGAFCQALKGDFQGRGDPAHVLWLWLTSRAKYSCDTAYCKTVAAIRAYVVGKQLMRHRDGVKQANDNLYTAKTDLFEWDETYTKMLKRGTNETHRESKIYQEGMSEEERLAQEVEEALAALRE